jgi:uncharacterized protein YuzE
MKYLFFLLIALMLSCSNEKETSSLKIFDSEMRLLFEEPVAERIPSDDKDTIYLKVKDAELLEKMTESKIGEKIRIEVDGKISGEPLIASSIKSGVIRISVIETSDDIFKNEKEATENLYNFD